MTNLRFSFLRVLSIVALLCALSGSASFSAVAQTPDADLATRIGELLTELSASRGFSGTVLVGQGDETLFRQGYGQAVREWDVPNDGDTVYFTPPFTTQILAMAILRLVEGGELELDDPVCDHLPNCPEQWNEITILHLLTHTSGITDEHADAGGALPLAFAPGAELLHSGYGYELLAKIVSAKAGVPYHRYLQETFFTPLGMDSTSTGLYGRIVPHRAEGYGNALLRASAVNAREHPGTAGMVSTVDDLFRWTRAVYGGEVVRQSTLDAMIDKAWVLEDDLGTFVGGFWNYVESGVPVVRSNGEVPGFQSLLIYVPDQDATIIVLSNQPNSNVEAAAIQILAMLASEEETS